LHTTFDVVSRADVGLNIIDLNASLTSHENRLFSLFSIIFLTIFVYIFVPILRQGTCLQ